MSSPSRLLLVMHRAALAGTERHVLWLGTSLMERGWDVSVVVSEEGPITSHFESSGIDVHLLSRRSGGSGMYGARLFRLIRSLKPDVLHAHSGRLPASVGRLARVPVVLVTRHGLGFGHDDPSDSELRREARKCRLAHRTITVCTTDRERLIRGGLAPDQVVAVPNGIPAGPVHCGSTITEPVRLGFLGRIEAVKDPLFFVPLCQELEKRIPGEWRLMLCGDGSLRSQLFDAISNGGVADRVTGLGETDGPDLVLTICNFLCLPSKSEGQPLSVLEAMQRGVVTVARRIAPMEELLGGEPPAGLLLPPDPGLWASEIVRLASSRSEFDRMAGEGKRRIDQSHTLDRMVDRVEAIYRDCLASRGGD